MKQYYSSVINFRKQTPQAVRLNSKISWMWNKDQHDLRFYTTKYHGLLFFFNASERRRDFCFQEHLPGVNCQLRWNSQEVWSNVTCLELNPTPQWKTFPQQNHCKVLPAFTRNRTTISIHERPTSITNACGFHWNVCTLCRTEFNETYRLKYSVISFSVVDSGKFPTRRYLVSRTISLLYYIPSNMNLKHADIFVWNSTLHYTLRLRCSPDKKFMQTAWRHYHVTCI